MQDLDTRGAIHDLVVHFYREVAFDDLLGPVFGEVAEVDWAEHIPRLIDYWCRVLLGHTGYDGRILAAHARIHAEQPFDAALFDRWYRLFTESVDSGWAGTYADRAKRHAAHMVGVITRRLTGEDVDVVQALRLEADNVSHPRTALQVTRRTAMSFGTGAIMTTIDASHGSIERTLGDLVAEQPARARIFERLGIDYCCHGQRSLFDASTAAGLDPVAVAEEIAGVLDQADADVGRLGPAALVDHILETHHRYLHEELPLLVALAEKVRDVHASRHPELVRVAALVAEIRDDLVPHLAKEEQVLFPAIREWAAGQRTFSFGTLTNPIRVMMGEHDRAGELLGQLRSATEGYQAPADGCVSYRTLYGRLEHLELDTHRHVHLENNVLFPAVTDGS